MLYPDYNVSIPIKHWNPQNILAMPFYKKYNITTTSQHHHSIPNALSLRCNSSLCYFIIPLEYFFITSQTTFLLSVSRPLVGSSRISVW